MMLKEINYKITTDHTLLNKEHGVTPELLGKLEGYHRLAVGGKRSSVKKLKDAIERYPKNPILKNYLSVLYNLLGEQEKAYEVNRIMMQEHPNYLFGKLNLANEYYFKEQYDKMPEILGNEMELQSLFPSRDTFHLNEVLSFYKCTVLYFCAIDDLDQAEIRYELMKELDPDAENTDIAFRQLFSARMQAGQKRYEEELKTKTLVKSKKQEIFDITHPPKFHHEEIEWLYTNGLHISEEKLNAILSLPRTTLIEDLERVLQDSIDRFGHFQNHLEANDWNEETMNFLVHAMCLLGELKASESRAAVLTILGQSYEFSELYFGDFMSILWEPFFKIFSDDLETCLDFMKRPGIEASQRSVITDMVEQVAWHFPERREEVIQWYGVVMQFYLQQNVEDNVIDSDAIGLMICNVIDIQGVELSLLIEQLFKRGLVSKGICGDWDDVQSSMQRTSPFRKSPLLTIADRYNEITSTWHGYTESEDDSDFNFDNYVVPKSEPVRVEKKIGRNEPCPCGSGKKYKKCCLN